MTIGSSLCAHKKSKFTGLRGSGINYAVLRWWTEMKLGSGCSAASQRWYINLIHFYVEEEKFYFSLSAAFKRIWNTQLANQITRHCNCLEISVFDHPIGIYEYSKRWHTVFPDAWTVKPLSNSYIWKLRAPVYQKVFLANELSMRIEEDSQRRGLLTTKCGCVFETFHL